MTPLARAALSPEEQQAILEKLWALLAQQVAWYTAGESTSVTEETAQELMDSLWYTLCMALEAQRLPNEALLQAEFGPLAAQGESMLRKKLKTVQRLWTAVCETVPPIENAYCRQTLAEIGRFFKRYDVRFFAHQIPCGIDYFLLLPVSETVKGVSYVEAYLRRMQIENQILNRLDPARVVQLLRSSMPDFADSPLNVCEQPLTNAVGRALLALPVAPLEMQNEQRREIIDRLGQMQEAEIADSLQDAATLVCAQLSLTDPAECAYVAEAARALQPRLAVGLETGDLSRLFISMLPGNLVCADSF